MRRKARPIWWLMALGVVATVTAGAWLYFNPSVAPAVVQKAQALVWKEKQTQFLLNDDEEECRIVASYVRRQGLKNVSPVLERGLIYRIDDVSTEDVASLDCTAAFRRDGVDTTKVVLDPEVGGIYATHISRVYFFPKPPVSATFSVARPCPVCGGAWTVVLTRASGRWAIDKEAERMPECSRHNLAVCVPKSYEPL